MCSYYNTSLVSVASASALINLPFFRFEYLLLLKKDLISEIRLNTFKIFEVVFEVGKPLIFMAADAQNWLPIVDTLWFWKLSAFNS